MGIEKDIDELAKLAHDAWALENLIEHISSMSDEELKKALPRILKLRWGIRESSDGRRRASDSRTSPGVRRQRILVARTTLVQRFQAW
jgi:hypothetical protein